MPPTLTIGLVSDFFLRLWRPQRVDAHCWDTSRLRRDPSLPIHLFTPVSTTSSPVAPTSARTESMMDQYSLDIFNEPTEDSSRATPDVGDRAAAAGGGAGDRSHLKRSHPEPGSYYYGQEITSPAPGPGDAFPLGKRPRGRPKGSKNMSVLPSLPPPPYLILITRSPRPPSPSTHLRCFFY